MKVALINTPYFSEERADEDKVPSFGIGFVAKSLQNNNIDFRIFDLGYKSLQHAKEEIYKMDAEYFAITFFQENVLDAIVLLKEIKSLHPTAKIIVGGIYPTLVHIDLLSEIEEIDYIIRGDAELDIVNIITAQPLNAVSRRVNNELVFSDKINRINDLDSFSPPILFSPDEEYRFSHKTFDTQTNVIPLVWSRGCNYGCAFCAIREANNSWRSRSIASVVEEVRGNFVPEKNNHLKFFDANPLIGGDKFVTLIKTLRKEFDFTFTCAARADNICNQEENISKLSDLGCIVMEMGIESFNNATLDYYNKGLSVSTIRKSLEILQKTNISPDIDFILFHPNISIDELHQMIAEFENLGFRDDPNLHAMFSSVLLYSGTKLRADYEKNVNIINYKFIPDIQELFKDERIKNIYSRLQDLKKYTKELRDCTTSALQIRDKFLSQDISCSKKDMQELLLRSVELKVHFFNTYKDICYEKDVSITIGHLINSFKALLMNCEN